MGRAVDENVTICDFAKRHVAIQRCSCVSPCVSNPRIGDTLGAAKIPDLVARWQDDTIALKPDILSILIGVNDVWRGGGSVVHRIRFD